MLCGHADGMDRNPDVGAADVGAAQMNAAHIGPVTSADVRAGLYGLKPWFAARLAGVRRFLVAQKVPPWAITAAGVGFGGAAGAVLALVRPGPVCGLAVAALLIARLGCANLDGGVARESGRTTRFGAVVNELGDRAAELATLAGCLALAPGWLVAASGLAMTLPSWVSLAGAAAGAPRLQGGPVGKTERCLLLAALAATGADLVILPVLALGSTATALIRIVRLRTELGDSMPIDAAFIDHVSIETAQTVSA
jgi:CDP-diacylglycerol---glycerol-3-phosphate 3-phosphatidyltransferase